MFSINRNHRLFVIFFFAKKHTLITIVRKYFMQDELFFTHNHQLLIFGQKRSVITIGEKYFMQNLLFFNRPRSSIVCYSFCVKKNALHSQLLEDISRAAKMSTIIFYLFFSRHFTFYSDWLKVLSNLKNEKKSLLI